MYQIYFILEWHSTCFGRSFRPSSGVQDCHIQQQLLLSAAVTVAVRTVLELLMMDGKAVRNRYSVTPNKIDLRHRYIYRNNIAMYGPMNVKSANANFNWVSHAFSVHYGGQRRIIISIKNSFQSDILSILIDTSAFFCALKYIFKYFVSMRIWECRSGRLERKRGCSEREYRIYWKRVHLLWSRCHRIEASFWNPWFYPLHKTSTFKKSRILCKNPTPEALLLCLIILRTTWHLSHPDNTLCPFAIAYKFQYYDSVPGVQTEFVQYGIPIYIFNIILQYNPVSGLFL